MPPQRMKKGSIMNRILAGLVAVAALSLGACASDPEMAAGPTEAEITERLANFDTSGEFTRINAAPFDSQHAATTVSVWVSAEGVELYRGIDPDDTAATVDAFPVGTMIVKEQFDDAGMRDALTVMVKGAEGGDPATADWWWGMTDPDGTIRRGGSLAACISCHEGNGLARTDWVAGVHADHR